MEWKAKREDFTSGKNEREMYRYTWILIILLLVPIIPVDNRTVSTIESESIPRSNFQLSQGYHPVVYINTNNGFETIGFPGDGTESNPYILADMQFSTIGYGISITGTDAFFVIRNCTFTGGGTGIRFILVENGRIENCTFEEVNYGVECYSTTRSNISDSKFRRTTFGIYFDDGVNCSLYNLDLELFLGIALIELYNSEDVLIRNVTAAHHFGRTYSGIQIGRSSRVEMVLVNIAFVEQGIEVRDSQYISIHNTTIKAEANGILWRDSDFCVLSDSWINSFRTHIRVSDSLSCMIIRCTFESITHASIDLRESQDCLLQDCILINSDLQIDGDNLSHWTHTILNVTSDGKDVGYVKNQQSIHLNSSDFYQLFIIDCADILVSNSNQSSTLFSIEIHYSEFCQLENITISNSSDSRVSLSDSSNIQVVNLTSGHLIPLFLIQDSQDLAIRGSNMSRFQLRLSSSTNVSISNTSLGFVEFYNSIDCLISDSDISTLNLAGSQSCEFIDLHISNPIEIYGGFEIHWEHQFTDVFVMERPLGYFYDFHVIDLDAEDFGQIILAYCTAVTIQ
ncbi:MAG: right-handed parallel beta-helix repeat-containing protein, partial [Candidatus Thorarchaeota archaeon]